MNGRHYTIRDGITRCDDDDCRAVLPEPTGRTTWQVKAQHMALHEARDAAQTTETETP